jgi:hypothetical protein
MRPRDVASVLAKLIPTREPLFLWGPPGVGKSDLVRQAAEALSLGLVDVRAVLLDPVDLRGLPAINGDHKAHWCAPAFLPHDKESKGLLFLDELAQAPPLVQSACLQLTLDRRIGEYLLPDGWSVVAASNRQEDRAGAHRIITPLLNRFASHLDVEVSTEDWAAWAVQHNIRPQILSFINFRPSSLHVFRPDSGDRAFASPRSWEKMSRILSANLDDSQLPVVAAGCVGQGPATEFVAFLRTYRDLPELDAVLSAPDTTSVPSEPSVVYALIGALVEKLKNDPKAASPFSRYCARMQPAFATVAFRDGLIARSDLLRDPAANAWLVDHRELLAG